MTDRQALISLIHAARIAGRSDFARTLAADWLASWPGDLELQFLLAQSEVEQGLNRPAAARLGSLLAADPEFVEAYDLLASALRASGDPIQAQTYTACAGVLRSEAVAGARAPSWAIPLLRALQALGQGDARQALTQAQESLTADPDLPLPALIALQAALAAGERATALALARVGHDRWPECLAFRLVLAGDLLERGQTARGVEMLHRTAADDPTGRIARKYLGEDHPYSALWPSEMTLPLERQIPAEVAAILGENRLAGAAAEPQKAGPQVATAVAAEALAVPAAVEASREESVAATVAEETADKDDLPRPLPWEAFRGPNPGDDLTASKTKPEEAEALVDVRDELDRMAARLKAHRHSADEDRRMPAYIVMSCRTRLAQEYGEDRARRIDEAVSGLVETIRARPGWTAYRVYLDDPNALRPFGLTPADPQNAWQLKLRLADLDAALANRRQMIAALLIVGGHRIVPFHTLPNPTDDDDEAVPSDNPYASTDENYFAPEWAVGRLPAEDASDLVDLLRAAEAEHRLRARPANPITRLRLWIAARLPTILGRHNPSIGYTASIWRKASLAVYRVIGEPASMMTSPPVKADTLPPQIGRPVRMSYFNLHGIEDGPEWFGQRDPLEDGDTGEEYPVALRPQDVVNSGRAPRVVFTEACYGANTLGKTAESALCLKFLASGSRIIVGSTKISYGSVAPPLIGADLLGRVFWDNLNRGLTAGEALRRAKLSLAAEMHRRQGFLDGEDQKTLTSFVLYGDPLYTPSPDAANRADKNILRRTTRPTAMKTSCALGGPAMNEDSLDPATLARVKSIVSRYLPGMDDAQCRIHGQRCGCDGKGHECPSHQLGVKLTSTGGPETVVVTFAKTIQAGHRHHARLARLTLDPSGKVLKLAVSR